MAESTTKLPVKTEKKSASSAPAPWAPLDSLRREVDRLFDSFGVSFPSGFGRHALSFDLPWPRQAAWEISPAVDVAESEKEYEITAELPGLTDKDIEVKLSNGNLVIKGEKKEEKEEKGKDFYLSERRFGSFVRTFATPPGVESGKIEASFSNGVLTVKLPKTAEAIKNETKIAVKAA